MVAVQFMAESFTLNNKYKNEKRKGQKKNPTGFANSFSKLSFVFQSDKPGEATFSFKPKDL